MVYESLHKKRLQRQRIRIITEYYDNGVTKRRSSDGVNCDDVENGVILDKKYFAGEKCVLQETEFNPGILYSFVYPETKDGLLQCPACGGTADRDDFSEGCPYCGAPGNMEYADRKAGERDHADSVVGRSAKNALWFLLCVVVGIAVCMPITVCASRTAFFMDYVKGAAIGLLLGLAAFLALQVIRSRLVLRQKEREKQQRQNTSLQTFLRALSAAGLSLKAYHNGLSAELNRYFYTDGDASVQRVTDYDVLDFRNRQGRETAQGRMISADVQLRIVLAEGSKLSSETGWWNVALRHESDRRVFSLHEGLNMIECPNCGAKVNIEEPSCRYCGSPVVLKSPLSLTSIRRTEPVQN